MNWFMKIERNVMYSLTSWYINSMICKEMNAFYLIECISRKDNDYCVTIFIRSIIEVKLDPS